MTKLAKIHLLHTTASSSSADTDGQIILNISAAANTHSFPVSYLSHDEREKNKTDHYAIDVFHLSLDDSASLQFVLETTSTDGWLPKSVYVIGQNIDGACKLLAGTPNWTAGWLDKPSTTHKTIPSSNLGSSSSKITEIRMLVTTSSKSNAGSDGAIYLDIAQGGLPVSLRLDTPNNDFVGNRTDEFSLSLSSHNFTAGPDLTFEIRNSSTDGWLPNDVFIIAKHSDGKVQLLQAVPSWGRKTWIDSPGNPVRPVQSAYTDISHRGALAPDPQTYYCLKSLRDDWQMGVENSSFFEADVLLNQEEADGANQWRFTATGTGAFYIQNRLSGMILKSNGLSSDTLSVVSMADGSNDPDCMFVYHLLQNGTCKILLASNQQYGIALKGSPKRFVKLCLSTQAEAFDLIPIRVFMDPEKPYRTTHPSLAAPSDLVREMAVGLAAEAISAGIPGGGTLFAVVFSAFFDDGPDYEDLFRKFRNRIMAEVHDLLSENQRTTVSAWLESIQANYMTFYLSERKNRIEDPNAIESLADDAQDIGESCTQAIANLLPSFDSYGRVIITDYNIELIRTTFPVYLMGTVQAINAFQEAALISALDPNYNLSPRISQLQYWANATLANIQNMYIAIKDERMTEFKKKYRSEMSGQILLLYYYWEDTFIGESIVEMGQASSTSSYHAAIRDAYKSNLEFSYFNYLYKYSHVERLLLNVVAETTQRCNELRNDPAIRAAFISRAKTLG